MTTEKFRRSDAVTAKWEGGNVDHPKDPGGRTSRGVTQNTYNAFRSRRGRRGRDVFQMTEDERHEIYVSGYWTPMHGEDLPNGVDLVAYDAAVNSGPGRSAKWLQQAINDVAGKPLVKVDGAMGPKTANATRGLYQARSTEAACARRRAFLKSLRIFATFGRGWLRRVADVEARGVAWAMEGIGVDAKSYLQGRASSARVSGAVASKQAGASGGLAAISGGGGFAGDLPVTVIAILVGLALIGAAALFLKSRQDKAREEAFTAVAKEMSHV